MNPDCPKCQAKGDTFMSIPDSLGRACKCGFVWVGYDDEWQVGPTVQQWFRDTYGKEPQRGTTNE